VLQYTDAITADLVVEFSLFRQSKAVGRNEQAIVELTAIVAGYNCVSKFLIALEVDETVNP
jgi:hypothetical protein